MKKRLNTLFLLPVLVLGLASCDNAIDWSDLEKEDMQLVIESVLPFIKLKDAKHGDKEIDNVNHYYIASVVNHDKSKELHDSYVSILGENSYDTLVAGDSFTRLTKAVNDKILNVDVYYGAIREHHASTLELPSSAKTAFLIDAYLVTSNEIIETPNNYLYVGGFMDVKFLYKDSSYRLSSSSSAPEVATLSDTGTIDALSVGTTTITYTLKRIDNSVYKSYSKIIEVVTVEDLSLSLEGGYDYIDYYNDLNGGTKVQVLTPICSYEVELTNITFEESPLVTLVGNKLISTKSGEGYFTICASLVGTGATIALESGVLHEYKYRGWAEGALEIVDAFFAYDNTNNTVLPYMPNYQHTVNVLRDIDGNIEYFQGMEVIFRWQDDDDNRRFEYGDILERYGYYAAYDFTTKRGYKATQYAKVTGDNGERILVNAFMVNGATLTLNVFHETISVSWNTAQITALLGNEELAMKIPHLDNDENGYKFTFDYGEIYEPTLYVTFCGISGAQYLELYQSKLLAAGFVYSDVLGAYTDTLDIDAAGVMITAHNFGEFYITIRSMRSFTRSFPVAEIREALSLSEDDFLPIVPVTDEQANYFELYIETFNKTRIDIYILAYGFDSTRVRDPETGLLTHNANVLAYIDATKEIGYTNTEDAKAKLINVDCDTSIIIDDAYSDGLDICLTYDPTFVDYSGSYDEYPTQIIEYYFGSMCDTPVVEGYLGQVVVEDNTYAATQNMKSMLGGMGIPWPEQIENWVDVGFNMYVLPEVLDEYIAGLLAANYVYNEEFGTYIRGLTDCGVFPSIGETITQKDIDKGDLPAYVEVGYAKLTIVYYPNENLLYQ